MSTVLSRYYTAVNNLETVVPPNSVITNYFRAACSHVMLRDSMTDERSVCGRLACRIMRSHTALSDASKITNQAGAGVDWWREAGVEEKKRREEKLRAAELRDAMYGGGDRMATHGRSARARDNRHVGRRGDYDRKFNGIGNQDKVADVVILFRASVGRVVSYDELQRKLYGSAFVGDSEIRRNIYAARKRLLPGEEIRVVPGIGYLLVRNSKRSYDGRSGENYGELRNVLRAPEAVAREVSA